MRDYFIITDDMLDDSYLEHYGVLGMKWHHHNAKLSTHYANQARRMGNTKVLKSIATALPPKAAKKYYDKLEAGYRANAERELGKNKKNASKHPNLKNASKYTKVTDADAKKSYRRTVAVDSVVGAGIGLATNPDVQRAAKAGISKLKDNYQRNKYANKYGIGGPVPMESSASEVVRNMIKRKRR